MRNIEKLLASLPKDQLETLELSRHKAPVKLVVLAKKLGLRVFEASIPMRAGAPMAGALRTGDPVYEGKDGYWIECHKHDSETRKRFTIAHEIGHYLFHKHMMTDDIEDNALYHSDLSIREEVEANKFAAWLLMPDELIAEYLEQGLDMDAMAKKFNVSRHAMAIKLNLPLG